MVRFLSAVLGLRQEEERPFEGLDVSDSDNFECKLQIQDN